MRADSSLQSFPALLATGTAVPKKRYTQAEIAKLLKIEGEKALRFFQHEHIKTRHLEIGVTEQETTGQLLEKFKKSAAELSEEAVLKVLKPLGMNPEQIDFLACVTSTGFIVPSLSALLAAKMSLRPDCQRADIVGMGCSAGLNGLSAVANWCSSNPGKTGILICCEISSAIYVMANDENTALVNSLFGDGVVALAVRAGPEAKGPRVTKFSTHTVPGTLGELRFDWNGEKNLNQFYLSKHTPSLIAAEAETALKRLLGDEKASSVDHWIVHTGGAAILDKIEQSLKLAPESLKHTRHVLKNYGNISSGSFLFSFQELLQEGSARAGQRGVMMTMGPGVTIEMALLQW